MSLIEAAKKIASSENQDKGKGKKQANKQVNTSRQDLDLSIKVAGNIKNAKSNDEALRMHEKSDSLWNESSRKLYIEKQKRGDLKK